MEIIIEKEEGDTDGDNQQIKGLLYEQDDINKALSYLRNKWTTVFSNS